MSDVESYLGVDKSLSGRRWIARACNDRNALAMAQRLGVPEIVGRVLDARGIDLDEAESFLNPTLKDLLPDPSSLKDMEAAADRLAGAVIRGEGIAVFGDYDVDGATSSALLKRFFKAVGADVQVYIPDRIAEGYGPNVAAMKKLREGGAAGGVTVDCGTTSHEPLQAAADDGLDVVVVDHHVVEEALPTATAVVNPNRLDDDSGLGILAAVGVSFMLAVGVNRALRQQGWYTDKPEPDLLQWLDLVALGTVCDVVPLKGVNRALVKQGLKVMAGRHNTGLTALADVAGIDEPPGAYHAGYIIGPRINAGGRVGKSDLGSRILSSNDGAEASDIASQLDTLNRERQEIEARVQQEAMAQVEASIKETGKPDPLIIAAGEGWHPGVVGIVASRLKEKFDRPAFVIGIGEKEGTGSGRSVTGIDLGAAVIAARQAGILKKGGGHAMAAGLTVPRDRLEDLRAFLNDRLADDIAARPAIPGMTIDGGIAVRGANLQLAETLAGVGPYGAGNPEPRFVIRSAVIAHADPVGRDQSHLRLSLTDESGKRLNGIAFGAVETPMGQALLKHGGAPFHIAGKIRVNSWQGRSSAQIIIEDAAPVW